MGKLWLSAILFGCLTLWGCSGMRSGATGAPDSSQEPASASQLELLVSPQKDDSEQFFLLDAVSGTVTPASTNPRIAAPVAGIPDNLYGFDASTNSLLRYPIGPRGSIGQPIVQAVTAPPTGDAWRVSAPPGHRYLYATKYIAQITPYILDEQNNISGPSQSVPAPVQTQQIVPDPQGRYIAVAQWQTCLSGDPPPPCAPAPNQISIYLLDAATGLPASTPSSVATGLPWGFYLEVSPDGSYLWLSGPELDTFTVSSTGLLQEIDHQSFATGSFGLVFDPQRQFALGVDGHLSVALFGVGADGVPREAPSNITQVLTGAGNPIFDAYGKYVTSWTGPVEARYYAMYRFDRSTGNFTMITKLPVTSDFVSFLPLK